jgi:hypothetical protein
MMASPLFGNCLSSYLLMFLLFTREHLESAGLPAGRRLRLDPFAVRATPLTLIEKSRSTRRTGVNENASSSGVVRCEGSTNSSVSDADFDVLITCAFNYDGRVGYGVPAEWPADVNQAAEDSLLLLADHLPGEAAEALLE